MKKLVLAILLECLVTLVFANNIDYGALFKNQQGCFILYDLNTQKIVSQYNEPRCAEQIAPDSTFKIALSLMAFDQNLITQKTIFRWDHRHNQISAWNQNQKPATWLKYSVVWVSQRLTHQLGMEKILYYLKAFNYGNQDFSGDPGLNNALDRAWLGSSLKISANEQIQFLSKMIQNKLPVTPAAINNTEVNMFMGRLNNGWQIFGKTGTHVEQNPLNMRQITSQDGWFVGWAQRGKQIYVFVTNFTDTHSTAKLKGGKYAQELTLRILAKLGLFTVSNHPLQPVVEVNKLAKKHAKKNYNNLS